jgi:hypothetical protein
MAVVTPEALVARDIYAAAREMGRESARYLVDLYYAVQRDRIRASNQVRALAQAGEPRTVMYYFAAQFEGLEEQIKKALLEYASADPVGQWSMRVAGIGPVIAAGLLAHIDIEKAPTVGKVWRFAGLDPTVTWQPGQKRPWNASLKVLCWKIGQSWVKLSGTRLKDTEEYMYVHLYLRKKAEYQQRNEAGGFAELARLTLEKAPGHAQRAIYAEGKIPPGRIDAMARRWAVKLFLAHWHHVAYVVHMGQEPPKPYVIQHLGHTDYIKPPCWP